jgi:HK97 family phage prohead protease
MKLERRFLTSEVRATTSNGKLQITGLAARFNSPTGDRSTKLLGFRECVKPGAFKRAIAECQDVRCLQNHDPNLLMGRTKNSTLRLSESTRGLEFTCDLPNTQAARDLHALVQRGDISQCSFAFIDKNSKWGKASDGVATRDIYDCDLSDVSAVTDPVYEDTEVNSINHDGLVNANHIERMFPEGMPIEVRSAFQLSRLDPVDRAIIEYEARKRTGARTTLEDMAIRLDAAYRSAIEDLIPE